jgi:hypothetical protein
VDAIARATAAGAGKAATDAAAASKQIAEQESAAATGIANARRDAANAAKRAAAEAKKALEKSREAFATLIESLNLKADIAAATKGLRNDLAAQRKILAAVKDQIKVEGETEALLRQRFETQQRIAEIQKQAAANARQARQSRQFLALGLTTGGEQRTPSIEALRKRLGTLRAQVKGTLLDTPKTQAQLARIAKVLSGAFGKVGRDVRQAILAMFGEINGALSGVGGQGPVTKAKKLNANKLLSGVGLSEAEVRELRSRLSQLTTASTAPLSRGPAPRLATATAGFGGGLGGALVIHSHLHVDKREVASAVTEVQQKDGRLRGGSRGGVNPGGRR